MATTGAVATLQASLPAMGSAFHAAAAWNNTNRGSASGTADKVAAFAGVVKSVGRALQDGTLPEGRAALAIRKLADLGADVVASVADPQVRTAIARLVDLLDAHGERTARLARNTVEQPNHTPVKALSFGVSTTRRTGADHGYGQGVGYNRERARGAVAF